MKEPFTKSEAKEVYEFATGERGMYGSGCISDVATDKLYNEFYGEMPYGIMKARTGDPDVWLSDYFSRYNKEEIIEWISNRTNSGFDPDEVLWPFP